MAQGTAVVPPIKVPTMVMEDFPAQPTGVVQSKLARVNVAKAPAKAAVSRAVPPHLRGEAAASDEDLASMLDAASVEPSVQAAPVQTDEGEDPLETILNRFQGTTEEKMKQMAKSYGASEKALRQLQQEKALLLAGKPLPPQNPGMATAAPPSPVAQPAQMVPVTQQVTVNPFDYKKAGSQFLDDIEGTLKSFDEHQSSRVAQSINQVVQNLMVPVYDEVLQMRFASQFPDVVTEDNWPIIKVLASQSEGATDREKLINGVKKYQKQITLPAMSGGVSGEMAEMRASVQQPSAVASAGVDKKTYKMSQIRKIMQRPDYGNDLEIVRRIETAFSEGRVDRNA